jgi:hypothetical protein
VRLFSHANGKTFAERKNSFGSRFAQQISPHLREARLEGPNDRIREGFSSDFRELLS